MKSLCRTAVTAALAATFLLGCSSEDDGGGDPALTTVGSTAVSTTDPASSTPDDANTTDDFGGVDVCGLLEGIDLDEALGEPAGDPTPTREQCTVLGVDTDSPASINISFIPDGGTDRYAKQNELLGMDDQDLDESDLAQLDGPVDGLGDEAVKDGPIIHARKDDQFLRVQVLRSPLGEAGPMDPEDLIALAQTVADNAEW